MDEDSLKALCQYAQQASEDDLADPQNIVAILTSETVKFRDKLKDETGEILTVADTRSTLDALTTFLVSNRLPNNITPTQKELAQIWIECLRHPKN